MSRPNWTGPCWSGGPDVTPGRMLAAGALIWGVYAVAQVLVNGVVLDETVVPAQIIANAVTYPPGHPHAVFYRTAYSLAHFLSAALWLAIPSAEVISALRNWLFLFASVVAPFAVTLVLTRKPYWAHLAVALVLLEAPLRYAGVYPMWIFPNYYSNGNIGLHLAVLTAALLLGGMWRTGGALLGLMPGIHATLALAIWPWAALFFLLAGRGRDRHVRRETLIGFAAGGAVSAGLAIVIAALPAAAAAVAPYVTGLPGVFRDGFLELTDLHRQPLPWFSLPYLLHPVGFGVVAFLLLRAVRRPAADGEKDDASNARWLIAMAVGAWAVVYGAHTLRLVLGDLPGIVVTTMPWRFSNVSAVLLVPLTVAALGVSVRSLEERRTISAHVIVAALVLLAALAAMVQPSLRALVSRNLQLLFWGVLVGVEWSRRPGRVGATVAFAVLVGTTALFWSVTNSAAYVVAAAAGTVLGLVVLDRLGRAGWVAGVARGALTAGLVVAAAAALPHRDQDPVEQDRLRWDMVSETDRALRDWLHANARPDELVLTPFYPRAELQAKTGQPVLLELETLWIMTYMPRLAPVIGTMVFELYGVDYRDGPGLEAACNGRVHPWCRVWSEGWANRSRDTWEQLAGKYGFRLVLAPEELSMDAPRVWSHGHWALYEIGPQSPPAAERSGP